MKRPLAIAALFGTCILHVTDDARGDPGNAEPLWTWAESTASPSPVDDASLTDREAELLTHCGAGEAGLRAVAKRLVARKARDLPFLDLDGLSFAQRAAGEPHVWPRAWVVSGRALDHDATLRKLDAWRASFRDLGERRCGVASGVTADGTQVIAALAVDALGDLAPLPTRARTGSWITVDATIEVPARDAHVLVQGPGSDPRSVPTSFESGHLRARFALDRPGPFTMQVIADVGNGPRPVLEASLFADVEPPSAMPPHGAPGESEAAGIRDPKLALTRMIESLRDAERLPLLSRDPRLDALALAHAQRMLRTRAIGHDVGDGDPKERLLASGLTARLIAENVAHAESIALAHRALYASPSHRANLLRADFDRLGVAIAFDPDGSVWIAELFTAGLR